MTQHKRSADAIRVLIVDDHAMVRNGLATFLSLHDDIDLVGMVSSGEEAIQFCDDDPPDIVLMDLIMPGISGAEATRRILAKNPDVQVIALTSYKEKDLVREALDAKVSGYLLKSISGDELADVLRRVHRGQMAISPEVTRVLVNTLVNEPQPATFDLTWRETEVLELLVKGLTNAEIALALDVKPSTIKTHVSRIFSKLDVSSRVEAATMAVKHHLLP